MPILAGGSTLCMTCGILGCKHEKGEWIILIPFAFIML